MVGYCTIFFVHQIRSTEQKWQEIWKSLIEEGKFKLKDVLIESRLHKCGVSSKREA